MKCRKARKLIQELLDGTLGDRGELDEHIAACGECRAELAVLQQIDMAVSGVVGGDIPDDVLERISATVLPQIAERERRPVGLFAFRWAALAMTAAALIVGLGVGRWAWPRETTVTVVERVPVVQEKIVEVKVPVVRERVVVKEVPVVRTRVVYRDREPAPVTTLFASRREPVTLEPIIIRYATAPALPAPTLQQNVRPAELAEDDEEEPPAPTDAEREPSDDTTKNAGAAELASAARSPKA
jgi:anti-sigma factor RsiW